MILAMANQDQPHDPFLEAARLGARSPVLIEFDERAQLPRLRRLFDAYTLVDLAHAVMLVEQGIVEASDGARLVAGLMKIRAEGRASFPWLADSGSYLVQAEEYLLGECGRHVAGLLQTGRSRNDQDAAAERLNQRDSLLTLADAALTLISGLLDKAEAHSDTLMPGYTHMQHAQPWTFGHYLMRQVSIFERDVTRLMAAYAHTNLSSLGGAANAGTSWPIDRDRTSTLLGHDGIVVNSSDAGEFVRDYIEENTACLAIHAANLGRLATDLYVWSTWEFGLVEVHDSLAATSSIMPQKKNPHALERTKAVGGQAIGWLGTIMGSQRPALSTDLDFAFGDDLIGGYYTSTYGSARLMTEVIATLSVNEKRMAETAGAYWSTTSHLADELVRRHGLSFRAAHHIIAGFVRQAIEAGMTPSTVTAAALNAAGREIEGVELGLSDGDLRTLLDARTFLESRTSEGSVSPAQVRRHAAAARGRLAERRAALAERRRQADGAIEALLEAAAAMGTGPDQAGKGR